jgi:amino acid adenylation domain-containing protein
MNAGRRWAFLVQHYADLTAERRPDAPAIRCPREGTVTYAGLAERSNRLARALRAAGVQRRSRVALCLGRSASSVVAKLAIMKADAIYVPVHERSPVDRCRTIMLDCEPDAVVVDATTAGRIRAALAGGRDDMPLVVLGDEPAPPGDAGRSLPRSFVDQQSAAPLAYRNTDTDLAHILYTSGSTGRPKGVMISHLNVVNYTEWAVEYLSMDPRDRVLGTAPFHFDMSTFDLYSTQKAGATLCLANENHTLFPVRLVALMEAERVTLWKGVSSLLAYLARTGAVQPGRLPTLTRVLFSGERLPTRALMTWMEAFPEKRFYNVYGPTEATGVSTAYEIPHPPRAAEDTVPIGRACRNSEAFVLTDAGTAAGEGELGEICLRGSSLSPGYWNDPAKTERAFVTNPLSGASGDRIYRTGDIGFWDADGQLRLVGRRDEQVKWMGYRIELGEIAAALQAIPGVADAVVQLLPVGNGSDEHLVAFIETAGAPDVGDVLHALRERLPPYMIPRRVIPLDTLPRSDRGKVDRDALRRRYGDLGAS